MEPASSFVNTIVVIALTAAVVLIFTKHYVASLGSSLVATLLVVFALMSCPGGDDGTPDESYVYTPGGAVKLTEHAAAPPKKKTQSQKKTKKTKKRQSRARPTSTTAATPSATRAHESQSRNSYPAHAGERGPAALMQ